MQKTTSLTVEFGIDSSQECSGVLFEIPTTEVIGGDILEIRLWGMSHAMLVPYSLRRGTVNMGLGTNKTMPVNDIIEQVSFSASRAGNTIWTISSIISVIATGTIMYDNNGTPTVWASNGENKTASFVGASNILSVLDIVFLTGTFTVTYRSTSDVQEVVDFAEAYEFQCKWPIFSINKVTSLQELVQIDKVTNNVTQYCKEGQDITSLFSRKGYSCITVTDKTPLFGSVLLEYTRSPYYKVWEWTIPTGAQGQYWFFIYQGIFPKNKFSIELPDLALGTPEPRNIALKVVDRDSGNLLDNASVWIDGVFHGVTDANGVLLVNGILTGSHPIRVIRSGFVDTDLDNLYNDTLEIY
jgi:hypothetical protein